MESLRKAYSYIAPTLGALLIIAVYGMACAIDERLTAGL